MGKFSDKAQQGASTNRERLRLYRETRRIDSELLNAMNEPGLLTFKTLVDTEIMRIKA
jgi:hypothetical protein